MSPQSDRGRADRDRQEVDREIAKWTLWVAAFTGLLFVASVASDIFIYLQYYTASNAQSDNREQLKAVVTNSNNVIIVPDDISKPGAQVIIAPIFQNFGGTRTKYFKAHASLKYFEGGVPNNLDPSKPYLDFQAGETIIGPNSPYQGFQVAIAADDLRKAKDGEGQILYWGVAEYADIFDSKTIHHIRYCTLFKPQSAPQGKLIVQPVPYQSECNRND